MKPSSVQENKSGVPSITRCRVCGNPGLVPCVDIGEQYLSSIFPDSLDYRNKLQKYPMDLVLCEKKNEKNCGLVQLGHELDLSGMYAAYPYTSSSNASMKAILQDVADSGKVLNLLRPGDLVLDIGCNDGTLLSYFKDSSCSLLGIDAAQNIQPVFESAHFKLVRGFFSREKYLSAAKQSARLIFSIAMFYHLSDPVTFCREAAQCLDDEGVWIIQMAYLPSMLSTNMYDNIVHEHNGYYGIESLQWVLERAGLEIFDVLLNHVYGGSFRVFVKKKTSQKFTKTLRYDQCVEAERKARLFDPATYEAFDRRIRKTKDDLIVLLQKIKGEGKSVWVYGASTKGNTILQYCGIGKKEIVAAADANPFKFGKYIIGADIPIKDEAEMRRAKPDYLLALPYSFTESFLKREADLVRQGTKFIVPLPDVALKPA